MQRIVCQAGDCTTWDRFIAQSPSGHILQSWEWGELKARAGWEPVRIALTDGEGIRAAAQVLVRSLPYGLGRLAYVPKGPVLDFTDFGLVQLMFEYLRDLAGAWNVISLKVEPEVVEPSDLPSALESLGLRGAPPVQMRSTIWVDLRGSEADILGRQKQKTRYNIRLAAKKGVVVSSGGCEHVDRWHAMYAVTAKRDGFSTHSLSYYRQVLEILQPRGMANLLLAHHGGDLLAGIIVFYFGRFGQYMYGASSNEKRNLMAPYLLQWEGMRWAKSCGATTYDLWGIPDRLEENEDLWGVYRHKRGYGGDIKRYVGAFDLVQAPVQHFALEQIARPIMKRIARHSVQQAD